MAGVRRSKDRGRRGAGAVCPNRAMQTATSEHATSAPDVTNRAHDLALQRDNLRSTDFASSRAGWRDLGRIISATLCLPSLGYGCNHCATEYIPALEGHLAVEGAP
jgi:hypothetical protein